VNACLDLFGECLKPKRIVKKFEVSPCSIQDIGNFIETWHYSQSVNGIRSQYCFALIDGNELIGGAIFAGLGMANAWRKYGEREEDVLELRRLCCIDDTPKNTESYFISRCLKWLKKNTETKTIVSYADPYHGHCGTIYKASNFQYLGLTAKGKVINWNGKMYHDKAIRAKYNDKLKPFAIRLRQALEDGEAFYEETPGKHIYTYTLKR
jgi:hypothetical protein